MKKLEKALLALLLLAGMGGCTKKEAPSQETVKNKTKVCASINREDAKAETLVEIELKAAFAELADTLPTELSFYNVSKDQAAQNTAVDTMLKESCAAVIIELVDIAAAQPIMEKIQAAGLKTIRVMKYSTPMRINQRISARIFRKTMCCRVRSSHHCLMSATSTVMIRFQRPFFQSVN